MAQKKEDVFGALTYYRELAYFITRREEYERGNIKINGNYLRKINIIFFNSVDVLR